MKNPAIDLRPTPQNIQDRKRTELLMEIEEEEKGVPARLRALIEKQTTMQDMAALTRKLNHEYQNGQMSDKLLKRCGSWVSRRVEELRPHRRIH